MNLLGTEAAATAIALLPIATTSVSAAPPVRNEATVISHVEIDKNDPSVGYVRVRYTCEPSAQLAHLWVSVKQTDNGIADPALLNEGSGFGNIAAT